MKKSILLFVFAVILGGNVFSQCAVNLGNDTTLCAGGTYTLSILPSVNYFEDSLTIVYDATQGTTGLVGASKVYMHSGMEFVPFGGWQATTGNWGQDDGIGLMDSIGPNLWSITIHPPNYYNYPADTTLNGLFLVFRNADGSQTGKDGSNNDIWVNMTTDPPTSAFGGVTVTWKRDAVSSILWSTGDSTASTSASATGTYWVQVTDTASCVAADSINLTFGTPAPDLGPDVGVCAGASVNVTLDAGAGFSTYSWSGGGTSQTETVTALGTYWVDVTDGSGCNHSDTIEVIQANGSVDLGPDTSVCGSGGTILLDPGITLSPYGDSLCITFDATKGSGALLAAPKVYFHSAAELHPGGGWQYAVGNWGQDDGLGQMTQIGTDLWQICIEPVSYYGYPADSTLNGIWMVFRNADGSAEDKNGTQDIFLDMTSNPPASTYGGISVDFTQSQYLSMLWSDGSTGPTLAVNTAGTYWVEVTDKYGCAYSDTVIANIGSLPVVDLGPNQAICQGGSVTLDAGSGYVNYSWSTGDTTQMITVTQAGSYTVSVTDVNGCSGGDIIGVFVQPPPAADFSAGTPNGLTVAFTDNSTDADTYAWDFDNDGNPEDTTAGSVSHTFPAAGTYTVLLTVSNACGTDTMSVTVTVSGVDRAGEIFGSLRVFPNPSNGMLYAQLASGSGSELVFVMRDVVGKKLWERRATADGMTKSFDLQNLTSGSYFLEIRTENASIHRKIILEKP